MSDPAPQATSIRRRLLLFLLPSLLVLMLAGVYAHQRAADVFVRSAYDQRLADIARLLAAHAQDSPAALQEHAGPFRFSVVTSDGRLIAGESALVALPAASSALAYADATVGGAQLRLVTYRTNATQQEELSITVAEAQSIRTGPSHFLLAGTWLVDFIQVDVTLLIVWIGVHFGLRPVLTLRRQIEARSAHELRPLEVAAVPAEVRPLVDALNLLFEMLSATAQAQRQFVADTAHQLRTPIAGLLGSLQVLVREPSAQGVRSRLISLHEGVHKLSHSANQLLALARADSPAALAEAFTGTDLKAIIGRVVERNVERAVENGLDLGVESAHVQVAANGRLLEDLVGNLLDNALRYTPPGGRVTARSGQADGHPYVEVEDDGPGIPEAERGRVRERFYRMPGSAPGGCGLGLAIVEQIARQHGAHLLIETGTNGQGVRARVLFAKK
jgi:two-component system sensor histidine kinase TctE